MERKIIKRKQELVNDVKENIENSPSTYIVEYRGLDVSKLSELRSMLREENNEMHVYKNSIASRAFESLGHNDINEYLVGPNAFVFSKEDAVSAARILSKFAKKNKKLIIKSALVEGKITTENEIKTLATLPNKEGMISKLLGCLQAPVANLAVVLNEVAKTK